jgi:GntR family transcriptional repressor for pyruvate dehydrogenase complex
MTPLFRAAKQNRIFEDVVDQIQEAIISGRIKNGDRLPSERELREMLQTSRSTIREALRVLEQKGLIEIRLGTGGGAVVKSISADTITQSLALLIRTRRVSLDHLAEFRERVEGDVAALAAMRHQPDDIKHLRQLLEEAHAWVKRGPQTADEFLRVDREIHFSIAAVSGNPIYLSILKTLHDNIQLYFEKYLVMSETRLEQNYAELVEIVNAVEQGDADQARELTQEHVRHFSRYMDEEAQDRNQRSL